MDSLPYVHSFGQNNHTAVRLANIRSNGNYCRHQRERAQNRNNKRPADIWFGAVGKDERCDSTYDKPVCCGCLSSRSK